MDELMKKAAKFLEDNPNINEIGLEDGWKNKVHLVRVTPMPVVYGSYTYPVIGQWYWHYP